MILCQVKELWNISEKDWLNLTNHQQGFGVFYKKKTGGASIHRINKLFPLKPSLVLKDSRYWGGGSQKYRKLPTLLMDGPLG